MGDVRLALGAVIDVASSEDVKNAVTDLQGHLDKKLETRGTKPIRKPLASATSLTLASGATQVLSLGKPSMGSIWALSSITILGGDDGSSVANLKAAVYIGDDASVALTQCIIPQQSIPYFDSFGFPDYWVHDQSKLFVNFTASGPIAAQTVVVNAWVSEFQDYAMERQGL